MNLALLDRRTKVILFDINKKVWHLSGFGQGKEGATLGVEPDKLYMPDMELLWLEGARQDGARYQDTILSKREMDIEVQIAGKSIAEFHRRNDEWWRGWSTRKSCTLAVYTRTTGWRWIRVRLAGNIEPKWGKDPALIRACDYDMTVAADDPLWRSFKEKAYWKNTGNVGSGVLQFSNWADHESYPEYVMPGPGTYSIQDGEGGQMIPLPTLTAGQTLRLDTHPSRLILRIYDSKSGVDGRTAWKGMKTKRFRIPFAPYSQNTIKVSVSGGNANSQVYGVSSPRFLRPW